MESFSTLFIGSTSSPFSKEEVIKLVFSSSKYLLNIFIESYQIGFFFFKISSSKYLDIFSLQISSKYLDIFSLQISSKYLDIFSLQISSFGKNIFCYTYPNIATWSRWIPGDDAYTFVPIATQGWLPNFYHNLFFLFGPIINIKY